MTSRMNRPAARYSDYELFQHSDSSWLVLEPLPTDKTALEAQLRQINDKIQRIDDECDAELEFGIGVLRNRKREWDAQARARFKRVEKSATVLYQHECSQAKARYVARCEQLKQDMSDEIQREIRRLKQTRDGVSVMDRRRLTRNSGGGANNGSTSSSSGNGNTIGGGSSGMDGAYATMDGGSGGGLQQDDMAGSSSSSSAVFSSSSSGHLAEKKRLVVLLSATPIFKQLEKTITPLEAEDDLAYIHATMPSATPTASGSSGAPLCANSYEDIDLDEEEKQDLVELRRRRAFQYGGGDGGQRKRRRLYYNPERLQEGQRVAVSSSCSNISNNGTATPHPQDQDQDQVNQLLVSGVITAATATQVFILPSDGTSFQTINVQDWQQGRIQVHAI